MIPDPVEPRVYLIGNATESTFGAPVGPVTLQGVHLPEKCAGRACVVHAPSEHHMRDWPLTWRGDRGIMERACPHGIGHPDPDDIGDDVHGCDGCCYPSKGSA